MERLMDLFERAAALSPADRSAFLDDACGDDTQLRDELLSLLTADESAPDYFERLGAEVISPALEALSESGRAEETSALLNQVREELGHLYRIDEEVGGGAMSRVFLAEDLKLGRKVVIKVLPPDLAAGVRAERFRREIQLAAQLQHPHIVPLLTSDTTASLLYYTMPFVAGESLRSRLATLGALPVKDAVRIWGNVLDALAHAHARGIVHRDVKPANILLGDRNASVTDFGIARAIEAAADDAQATETGFAIGTPAYMAPEQVTADRDADHRVDIYAAALVMFEMLEGRLPFQGGSAREVVLARLVNEPDTPRRADCPPALAALVVRCLSRDPAARPPSAEIVISELEKLAMATATATPFTAGVGARSARELDDGSRGTASGAAPARRAAPPQRAVARYAVAALLLAVVVLGSWKFAGGGRENTAAHVRPASIAVFPLTNLSPDAADAALADGMTQELVGILGRSGSVRTIGSSSVVALLDRRLNVQQVAESLGVSHFLEGAFQKVGTRLRMQVRLVEARDGSTQWSKVYDREIGDVFAIQDDIARAVALELRARIGSADRSATRMRRHVPNPIAYEWYLRGVNADLMRSRTGVDQAIEYLNRAIAADSNFAAAYAGLVPLYLLRGGRTPRNYHQSTQEALDAGRKAVRLDDSLAAAHSALGWALHATNDWANAERELKRAVELDPGVYRGHEGLARVYMVIGRPAEQLAAAKRGLEVDPYSVQALREMALALTMNGRCDEALALLRPLKELSPPAGVAGVVMGQCYGIKGMWPEAIAEFRWVVENSDARAALGLLGYSLGRAGWTAEARDILSDLLSGEKDSHGAFGIALVYTGLRDYGEAFAWLDKSVDENSWRVYLMSPLFEDLHRDPRFAQVRRKMGLQ